MLAVDLQHQLDLVLHERLLVDLGPGRIQQLAVRLRVAQRLPEFLRNMRRHRIDNIKHQDILYS